MPLDELQPLAAALRHSWRTFFSVDRGVAASIARGGFFSTNYQYLTGYKGLVFFTKSSMPLELPGGIELVAAKKIWIPG